MVSPKKKYKLKMPPRENKTGNNLMTRTRKRKRQSSDYKQVEDDIQFIVNKKQKLEDNEIVFKQQPVKTKSYQKPSTSKSEKVSEDNRELNRRSPNGFLLPDPLPRGETLTDTIKQKWVLGKAIGVGGFGELYLASYQSKDGKLSPEKFVIKVNKNFWKSRRMQKIFGI